MRRFTACFAAALAVALLSASPAAAISFTFSGDATFTASGDLVINGGAAAPDTLAMLHSITAVDTTMFTLTNPGDMFTITLGSLTLLEADIDCVDSPFAPGNDSECDPMGFNVSFTIAGVTGFSLDAASLIPVAGFTNDPETDFTIDFTGVTSVGTFGTTGILTAQVLPPVLAFSDNNPHPTSTQNVTVKFTLTQVDAPPPPSVPEPSSVALLGLGLLAFGTAARCGRRAN